MGEAEPVHHARPKALHQHVIVAEEAQHRVGGALGLEVEDEAARFENLVASHLLKLAHFLIDYEGYKAELFFLRDVDKREVDFLVTISGKPWFAVEVRLTDSSPSPHLFYFKERLSIPHVYQVVKMTGVDQVHKGVRVVSAGKFLAALI